MTVPRGLSVGQGINGLQSSSSSLFQPGNAYHHHLQTLQYNQSFAGTAVAPVEGYYYNNVHYAAYNGIGNGAGGHQLQQQQQHGVHNNNRNAYQTMAAATTFPPVALLQPALGTDDNNGYFNGGNFPRRLSNSSSSVSTMSPSTLSLSPSSPVIPAYGPVISSNQTHDIHGVPALPSITPRTTTVTAALTVNNNAPPPQAKDMMLQPKHHNQEYQTLATGPVSKSNNTNSSRETRNRMEQLRRQKLNTCITQLSQLVPFISNSPKKMEKTAVLRLSAAYLRLSQILLGLGETQQELPAPLRNINLARIFLNERDMYLMITSTGKIVYVSEAVESLLGHSQNDLFGHLLYNIICPIDRDELKKNLKCDEELDESGSTTFRNDDPSLSTKLGGQNSGIKIQRRSFYLRLVKKAVSRGEQPGLELVYVSGCLLILPNSGTKTSLLGENAVLLHAVVRPFNERRVTEVSLLEATKEEYITRHLLDGRIIYVDHRISIVSGFMPQEVSGTLAFTYMHKDDVRWVMIALRQMYFKGQSFGSSCYRLLSKNGQFVYMKTYGFLELNPDEDQVASFICINVLVSPEEGKREILKMRERFTPLIRSRSEPGITAITNDQIMEANTTTSLEGSTTEDLSTINKVVEQMTRNIPAPAIDNVKETSQNPGPLPDSQFFRVQLFSKSMPPVLTSNAPKIEKKSSMSPQPNNNNIKLPIKSVTEVVTPPIAEVKPFTQAKPTTQVKPIVQDRPSVLRVAPPVARQPVVVYALQTNKYAEEDQEYLERRGGILVGPKRHNDHQDALEHWSKKPKIVLESQTSSHSDSSQLSNDSYDSMDDISSFRNPIKFHTLPAHNEHNIDLDPLTNKTLTTGLDHFSNTLDDNNSSVDPLFMPPNNVIINYNSYNTGVYNDGNSIDIIQDPIMQVLQQDGAEESEQLVKKQILLKTKMDQQQGQLNEIQTGLNSLSSNADTRFLKSNYSNLKAVHEEQKKQLLRTVQKHQNIGV